MEHRCTERISSELEIQIFKHNRSVAIGRIKNGSLHGVFVESDFMDIDCEHQLKLELLLNRNTAEKIQRIEMNAIIIHKTGKGFGAEVEFGSAQQANLFMEILQGTKFQEFDETAFALVV